MSLRARTARRVLAAPFVVTSALVAAGCDGGSSNPPPKSPQPEASASAAPTASEVSSATPAPSGSASAVAALPDAPKDEPGELVVLDDGSCQYRFYPHMPSCPPGVMCNPGPPRAPIAVKCPPGAKKK
jgi:hypothetical protein